MTKNEKNTERGIDDKFHSVFGFIVVALLVIFYIIVHVVSNAMPPPLYINNEVRSCKNKLFKIRNIGLEFQESQPERFIAERAKEYLNGLTELGPRVVGSAENEVLSVNYLRKEIEKIISEAHPNQNIEQDLQLTSGSYYLGYKPYGSINAYANLQNIVVKVYSDNDDEKSLLVNAHFDTVPTSPGKTMYVY